VQSQFAAEVTASTTLTFEQINQAFAAWLNTAYHSQVHSSTSQTPHARYFSEARVVRPVSVTQVESFFYERELRRVDPTFSDVSIHSRLYQVDIKLRGMMVEVQFNQFRIDSQQPDEVKLFSQQGIYLGVGRRYHRKRGDHPPQESSATKPMLDSPYLRALLKDHQQSHEQARQDGIDYKSAMQHDRVTLAQLGQSFSRYLGRSGLSSLTSDELDALEVFYRNHPQVRSWQVRRAFERAAGGGFTSTLWHLEQIAFGNERE
jgi:hypothetical protein